MELWTVLSDLMQDPRTLADRARAREAEGWDGAVVGDTQVLAADPFVLLALAAAATDRLMLSTAVSNPVTRHLTVTASGMIALQAVSDGRIIAGMGRGDSSLAYIGLAPVSTVAFDRAMRDLRTLLGGGHIDVDVASGAVPSASVPRTASIQWRPTDVKRVPINAIVSGPKSLAVAARWADRVTVAVGASVRRVAQAKAHVSALTPAERTHDPVAFGAAVVIAPHPDATVARELVSGYTATFARFSAMRGTSAWKLPDAERDVLEKLGARYEMDHHGVSGSGNSKLPAEFVDAFSIAGTPDHCIERLRALAGLGLSHLQLIPPGTRGGGADREVSVDLLNRVVLPELRQEIS